MALNIFHTPVVNTSNDAFWQPLPEHIRALSPARVLIVSQPFLAASPEAQQLEKMMTACKLQRSEYNILQLAEPDCLAWHQLKSVLKPSYVLLLGIHPGQLGISALFVPHAISNYDGVQWTLTTALPQLSASGELKQHLWNNVFKPVFLS